MLDLVRPCRVQTARLRLETARKTYEILIYSCFSTVPQYGVSIHADIQSYLYDVVNRPLVRLPAVSRPDAARVSG